MPSATDTQVEFTVDRAQMADHVAYCASIVTGRAVQPEHAAVALKVTDGVLHLRATTPTEHRTATMAVDAPDITDEIALPAAKLAKAFQLLDGEHISVTVSEDAVVLSSGRTTLKPTRMDTTHLITPQELEAITTFTLDGTQLAEAVKAVAFAASGDVIKPISGIQMSSDGTRLRFATTDSHRIAAATVTPDDIVEFDLLVPAKMLTDIVGHTAGEQVTFEVTENRCSITAGGRGAVVPRQAGQFPAIDRILERMEGDSVVTVPSATQLAQDVKRAVVLADTVPVRLEFDAEEGLAAAADSEHGSGGTLLLTQLDGPDITVTVNSDYLAQGLAAAGDRPVTMQINEPLKPFLLTAEADDDRDLHFEYVVMPMRV